MFITDFDSDGPVISFETDSENSLRIIIPAHYPSKFWSCQLEIGMAIAVMLMILVPSLCIVHDLWLLAAVIGFSLPMQLVLLATISGRVSKGKFKTTFDAGPDRLTIVREYGSSISKESYDRAILKAVDIEKLSKVSVWQVRIHGRYEWSVLPPLLPRDDAEAVASRLRTFLQLPITPASG